MMTSLVNSNERIPSKRQPDSISIKMRSTWVLLLVFIITVAAASVQADDGDLSPTAEPTTPSPVTGSPTDPITPSPVVLQATELPTFSPTFAPGTRAPTKPTKAPTTAKPSKAPTPEPTKKTTKSPVTTRPTKSPSPPTSVPSLRPSRAPTEPTNSPTPRTNRPSKAPVTKSPTLEPSKRTSVPSTAPTPVPTLNGTRPITPEPTRRPRTNAPTPPTPPSLSPTPRPSKPTRSPTPLPLPIELVSVTLKDGNYLELVFSDPIAIVIDNKIVRSRGTTCRDILITPFLNAEVMCRTSNDGLTIFTDVLRSSTAPPLYYSDGTPINVTTVYGTIFDNRVKNGSIVESFTLPIAVDDSLVPRVKLDLERSKCGNLFFSWSQSTGAAYEPFVFATWYVNRLDQPSDRDSTQVISSILYDKYEPKKSRSSLSRYILGSEFFSGSRKYVLQVELENWLGMRSLGPAVQIALSSKGSAAVVDNRIIQVLNYEVKDGEASGGRSEYRIVGPTKAVSVLSDFFLEVAAVFPDEPCMNLTIPSEGSGVGKYPRWFLGDGAFPRNFKPQVYRGNQYKLMVLSGQLGVGNYTFGVQLSPEEPDPLYYEVAVMIDQIPVITGGNRTLGSGENITLGIAGLDLRNGNTMPSANDTGIAGDEEQFSWSCRQRTRLADEDEDDYYYWNIETSPCTGQLSSTLRSQNAQNVTLPSDLLDLDKIYFFYTDITLVTRGPVFSALPSFMYRVDSDGGFSVEIMVQNEPLARSKINVQSGVVIRAQSKAKGIDYSWTMVEGDLPEDVLELIVLDKKVLRIPPYALTPGQRYSFRVSAVKTPVLFATVSFTGNGPPRGGFLLVEPAVGIAAQTDFLMEASLFEDEDLPLTYSFLVAKRDCLSTFCFGTSQSVFDPLTPFFPDSTAVTKLEYTNASQTLGVVAQDALGAVSTLVMANATVRVTRPDKSIEELRLLLQNAIANPEDGSKIWTDLLAALSVFPAGLNDSSIVDDLVTTLRSSLQASQYAPKKISSLVIENRVPLAVARSFAAMIKSSSDVLNETVASVSSVLERAESVLANVMSSGAVLAEGDADFVRSLTEDSLASSSSLLDAILNATANNSNADTISIPASIVAKLVRVQMQLPPESTPATSPTRQQAANVAAVKTFNTKNIQATFVSKFYQDLVRDLESSLVVDGSASESTPGLSTPRFVIPVDTLISQLDEDSVAFASSTFYKVNPYARVKSAENQSVVAQGIASLEVFDASSRSKLTQFGGSSPVEIYIQNGDSRSNSSQLKGEPWVESYVYNNTRNRTVQYFCGYWDTVELKWSTQGCSLASLNSAGRIHCKCNHTTDYTAWMLTLQDIVLTFTDTSAFNDANNGWAVVTILLIWAVCTVIFMVLGMYWDERDMKMRVRSIMFSLKLKKLRDVRIRNRVFTAWRMEALRASGTIVDASGAPLPPALSSLVSLERKNRLGGFVPPPVKVDMNTPWSRMWNWFSVALYREHSLLNTVFLLDAFLTRPMRVLCGAAVVLGEMFGSALFFNFEDDPTITPGTQVLVAFLSVLIVSPVVGLFVLLSRRVMAMPGAQRRYLQQMMVILLAELGDNRAGDDVKRWAEFARTVTWEELDKIHRYQALKDKLAATKRTQFPSAAEKQVVIKRLQQELQFHRELMVRTLRRDSGLYDMSARITKKDILSPKRLNGSGKGSSNGSSEKGGEGEFQDVDIDTKTAIVLDGEDIPVGELPISANTYRWLQSRNKSSPVSTPSKANETKGDGVMRKGSFTSMFQRGPAAPPSVPATETEIQTSGELITSVNTNRTALLVSKAPSQVPTGLWTPRPFHWTPRTAHYAGDDDLMPQAAKEDTKSAGYRLRKALRATKRCLAFVFCKPVFWLCRSRTSSWNRQSMPPPENDFVLKPGWIYFCYFLLLAYYAIAFFYVLSWGFRAKNLAVLNWIPTVAFSVFLDLIILQPALIFFRFALMNELAWRLEGTDFATQASGMFTSWRQKSASSARLLDENFVDPDAEDYSNNDPTTRMPSRKLSAATPRAVEPEEDALEKARSSPQKPKKAPAEPPSVKRAQEEAGISTTSPSVTWASSVGKRQQEEAGFEVEEAAPRTHRPAPVPPAQQSDAGSEKTGEVNTTDLAMV